MTPLMTFLTFLSLALLIVGFVVGGVVIGLRAEKMGRSLVGWTLFGIVAWPLALVTLLIIGETDFAYRARIEKEEEWRCEVRESYEKENNK